jgi:hypothetical protein
MLLIVHSEYGHFALLRSNVVHSRAALLLGSAALSVSTFSKTFARI